MKRKILSAFLATTMIFTTLAGCGGKAAGTEQAAAQPEGTKTESTETDAAAGDSAAAPDGEVTTIKFQTWNPGEGEPMRNLIADFEAKNPDIKVEYVFMPYTDHVEKLKVDLASGDGADVFGMQTGAIMNEFRDFEMDLTPYADASWGEGWQSKFIDFCASLLDNNGQYFGMPLGLTYAGFAWADKNMLKEYGLEIPKSYKDLQNAAKVLRDKGQYPLAIGAKDAWINIDLWMNIANDISSEKLYSAIDGKTPFTDADLVKSFEIWQSLFTEGIVQDGALGVSMYTDVTDLFEKEGSIPMYFNGSWAGGFYVNKDPDCEKVFNSEGADHDIFLIDWNDDGKAAPLAAGIDVVLCMNKDSKNPEAAWRFIDYMIHDGQDSLINKYFSYCPSRVDLELNVEGMNEDGAENLDFIVEQSKNNIGGYREMAYADLKQTIADTLTSLALGDITPQQAAEQVEAASAAQAR